MRSNEDEKQNQSDDPNDFDLILRFAKEKNEKELGKFICLDVCRGFETPISFLAKAGDAESVNFLLDHGASLDWAVLGAAAGKNKRLMDSLFSVGASIDSAIAGAASVGDGELVKKLRFGVEEKHEYYQAVYAGRLGWAVMGAGAGGKEGLMNSLLSIESYNGGLSKIDGLFWAVRGAAWGGQLDLVKMLIRRQFAESEWALWGAAAGGHALLLKTLIKPWDDISQAVSGAAAGGQIKLMRSLLEQAEKGSCLYAVMGATEGYQPRLMEMLIGEVALANGCDWAAKGVKRGNVLKSVDHLLKFLSFLNDDTLREEFANRLENMEFSDSASTQVSFYKNVLKTAMQINHDMRDKNLSYGQVLLFASNPELEGLHSFYSEGKFPAEFSADLVSITASYLTPGSPKELSKLFTTPKEQETELSKIKRFIYKYDKAKGFGRDIFGDQKDIKALKEFYKTCVNEDKNINRKLNPNEITNLYTNVLLLSQTKHGSASHTIIDALKNSPEIKNFIKANKHAIETFEKLNPKLKTPQKFSELLLQQQRNTIATTDPQLEKANQRSSEEFKTPSPKK